MRVNGKTKHDLCFYIGLLNHCFRVRLRMHNYLFHLNSFLHLYLSLLFIIYYLLFIIY